jgi:hypothetical protein
VASVKLVLRQLRNKGYTFTEKDLETYANAGWCPSGINGEYPDETAEELLASFELQSLLDSHELRGECYK